MLNGCMRSLEMQAGMVLRSKEGVKSMRLSRVLKAAGSPRY